MQSSGKLNRRFIFKCFALIAPCCSSQSIDKKKKEKKKKTPFDHQKSHFISRLTLVFDSLFSVPFLPNYYYYFYSFFHTQKHQEINWIFFLRFSHFLDFFFHFFTYIFVFNNISIFCLFVCLWLRSFLHNSR